MLNIKFIRENPDLVKENMKKKFKEDKIQIVDQILEIDSSRRALMNENQKLRARRNSLSKEISQAKKDGKDPAPILKEAKEIPEKIKETDKKISELDHDQQVLAVDIPNIMHSDVPIGKSDSENVEIKRHGTIKKFDFEVKAHQDVATDLGCADFDASAETSGAGFYFLQGDVALLSQALVRFAIDKMTAAGFTYVETPYLLRSNIINNVVDLHDQENMIYKVENEDLFLIGTSEHSLIGRYVNKHVEEHKLPLKQTSYSMCFRKEKGSHGLDERGLFRTHQFNKVEMVCICKPDESMNLWTEMKNLTVEIFNDLEIPIRELSICSGDLGDLKHIQYDIEAWSPRRNDYFEVGSCSNLTDAQSILLDIRVSTSKEKYYPHTLNNTAIATSRALVAILENNQNADGTVDIPKALQPYMGGKSKIEKQ